MFANINEDTLFSCGELTYYSHTLIRAYEYSNRTNKYVAVIENTLNHRSRATGSLCSAGLINTLISKIKKTIPDIKLKYKFIPSIKTLNHTYHQSGDSKTVLALNDTLKIYTNYNFIITVPTTFYNNKEHQHYIPHGWDYDSNEHFRKMRECVEYEITYFTDNSAPTKLPLASFDIKYNNFSWPAFPLVKKTLPAVYFDYLLENNQNYKLENAIFAAQEQQATLEATIKTQANTQATLEATIKTQADQQATLEAHTQELAAELLKQQAHHELFVENHTHVLTEMREKRQYLQQLHIADEAAIADLKTKADTLDMQKNVLQFQLATAELTTNALEERIKVENAKLTNINSSPAIVKDTPKQLCLIM
jgi:hypothetical protein